jgi:hypothetical protein
MSKPEFLALLPPGKWRWLQYQRLIFCSSPDHPPVVIDGDKVIDFDVWARGEFKPAPPAAEPA